MEEHPSQPAVCDADPHRLVAHRIFFVEDHPAVQEAFASVLKREDDLVLCGMAGTAEEALDQLKALPCDLVVTDVMLPGLGGIEFIGHLHAVRPEIPVLVISGHEEEAFARQAHQAGAVAFLHKRRAPRTLVPMIQSILRREAARDSEAES